MHRLKTACVGLLLAGICIAYSCRKEPLAALQTGTALLQIPNGFPAMAFPEGNEFNYERWLLGKTLFYDPVLSLNNKVSCASCHIAAAAFSDTLRLSLGDMGLQGRSNAPSLTNIGYHPYFTRAGGVPTLEMQVLVPIQEHDELNTNILDIADKLRQNPMYVALAQKAYNREIDAFVITRSLANFERSLISGNAAYDQDELSSIARYGKQLFFSERTGCSKCHGGFNFSNYAFENNGLYRQYADSGRMRLTRDESDRAKFKVPSLRNIAFTAPYMHDGSVGSLEAVVAHYNAGGAEHPNKSKLIRPLGLNKAEQAALVAFLNALSDASFIHNKNFRNEQ
ncbi:MAG TPA: cytochrome c peroxidase [Chitinophagaceae bacterium]|nr:cytochrome c peroxidase [Chitinophagaceae bacterium]